MFHQFRAVFAAGLLCLSSATMAQSPAPAPAAAPAVTDIKEVRAACRAEANAKSLKGPDRRAAIKTCVDTKRPDLAARREQIKDDRRACARETKEKGLKGPERRDAIQDCLGKKHPQIAKANACRTEAKSKNLAPRSPELRAFMKECVAKP